MSRDLPSGWRWVRLGEICTEDRKPAGDAQAGLPYLGMDQIESETGKVDWPIGNEVRATGFTFDSRHILYGKLRPYLNKVAVPGRPGRCSTELVPLAPCEGVDRNYVAHLLRRPETVAAAMSEKTGSRMPRANMKQLMTLSVPLPPLPEQRRIAAVLTERLDNIDRAKVAVEAQIEAARALPAAYLRETFESEEARAWPRVRLGRVVALPTSRSVTSDGDTEVRAITTAALTEVGFDPRGVKHARMASGDVERCLARAGEVLVARSNTPDLVGRAAVFDGEAPDLVVPDLIFRLVPREELDSWFLAAYMSALFLTGHWKRAAGGASGSMKKITKAMLATLPIPLPSQSVQEDVASRIQKELHAASLLISRLASIRGDTEVLRVKSLTNAFEGRQA